MKKTDWFKHPVRANIPAGWREEWLTKFIKEGVIKWMRKRPDIFNDKDTLATILAKKRDGGIMIVKTAEAKAILEVLTSWSFPETRRSPEKFYELFQLQHTWTGLCVGRDMDAQAHVLLSDIIGKDASNIILDDIAVEDLKFGDLICAIQSPIVQKRLDFDDATQTIWAFFSDNQSDPYWVHNDRSFQVALRALRQFNDGTVHFHILTSALTIRHVARNLSYQTICELVMTLRAPAYVIKAADRPGDSNTSKEKSRPHKYFC